MTHQEAHDYLLNSYTEGSKHDFATILRVLELLGNPQERLKIIHVAGTNGKGSVCSLLSNVLTISGYRTGMFTSPHLHDFNERFQIDGEVINDEDFAEALTAVRTAAEQVLNWGMLSYFELLTVVAFYYFHKQNVDFHVLETGIGGLRDVTNVIKKPVLSIITSIGRDHIEYLGDTIEEITVQKGGIIKKNSPTVLYLCQQKVYNIISEICAERGSRLYYAPFDYFIKADGLEGTTFSANSEYYSYDDLDIKLLGRHQICNAHTVLLAVRALRDEGYAISDGQVSKGLANTVWAGRLEVISKDPLIIVDGAHNVEGIQSFTDFAERYLSGRDVTIISGMLRDKDYAPIINKLSEYANRIVLTKPGYAARILEPQELYHVLKDKSKTIITECDFRRAVDIARKIAPKDGVICCAGSLYLVGDIRGYILGNKH